MSRSRVREQARRGSPTRTTSTVWRRQVSCARELGDGPHDVGHRDLDALGRPDPAAPGRAEAVERLDPQADGPEAVDDRLVARRPAAPPCVSSVEMLRTISRAASASRTCSARTSPLQGGQRRPGRPARRTRPGSGAARVRVAGRRPGGRWTACPTISPSASRSGATSRSSGCQASSTSSGSSVRHPAEVVVVRVDAVVRQEPERAPVVGDRDLVEQLRDRWCACPSSCARASSLPLTASTTRCWRRGRR